MEEHREGILVNIGIFSGLPNPEMKLADDMAARFAESVHSAIGKEQIHPPPAPRLGEFYGFLVQVAESEAKQYRIPVQLNVFRGVLSVQQDREQIHWRDVAGVERLLLRWAYEQGHGELLRKVRAPEPE